jgi:hypothetical protein
METAEIKAKLRTEPYICDGEVAGETSILSFRMPCCKHEINGVLPVTTEFIDSISESFSVWRHQKFQDRLGLDLAELPCPCCGKFLLQDPSQLKFIITE